MRFDKLSSQYLGSVGSEYEANRRDGKWDAEQQAAQELIARMPRGAKVLDAPVGIGRLIPILAAQRLKIQGLDVSPDMLAEATAHFFKIGASSPAGSSRPEGCDRGRDPGRAVRRAPGPSAMVQRPDHVRARALRLACEGPPELAGEGHKKETFK